MRFDWNWAFATEIAPTLVTALRITILATLLGSVLAMMLGLPLALASLSRSAWLRRPARAIVEVVRGTPLLIQLYLLFYVLPGAGIRLDPLTTGILALGLHYGAYTADIYRAGIEAVPAGQRDAGLALGFSRPHLFFRIVLPQALPPVLPALGNCVIAMFKDTPLLSTITVVELLNAAKNVGAETFRYLEPFTIVGVLLLVCSLAAGALIRQLEARMERRPA